MRGADARHGLRRKDLNEQSLVVMRAMRGKGDGRRIEEA
jgi:hypothetical protein